MTWKKITSQETIDWLGASGPIDRDGQAESMYTAEGSWHDSVRKKDGWLQTDKEAQREIGLGEARKLATEIMRHPSLDSIPNIDKIRKSFDPATDIVFTKKLMWRNDDGSVQMPGAMVTDENSWEGKPNRLLINKNLSPRKKMTLGGFLHEFTHLIVPPNIHGHNWAMARTQLHLARNFISQDSANRLQKHYDDNKVDYGGSL